MTSRRRVIPLFTLALLSLVAMSIVLSTRYDSQRHVLGVASQAFVISLPRRDTRRKDMHRLAKMMGSSWDFADAMDMANPAISRILTNVRHVRETALADVNHRSYSELSEEVNIPFSWPEDIDYLATSNARLPSASSDLWHSSPAAATIAAPQTETCSKYDFTLSPYAAHTPDWLLLTPPRVACWQSHASVIRRIVDEGQHGPFVVLEDDVDMEKDIAQRLRSLWSLLPPDWDIVFLGHCWSNEAHHPPLASDDLPVFPRRQTRLHPSNAPKCTHAYALSRIGARRLLLHLRHAPFAYSRAIDQAFSWLVATKRLKSFSVVPSVVIQRKADSSDINTNTTKSWKDDLADGCFAR